MDKKDVFQINEVSKKLGIKSRQIRQYCSRGYISGIRHMVGQRRTFTAEQVDQIRLVDYLRRAGFSHKDLRKYIMLVRQDNEESVEERLAMLRTHKRQVWQELEDLQATIDFLERQEELLDNN